MSSDLYYRNITRNSSGRRSMIPDGNLDLHQDTKSVRNGEKKFLKVNLLKLVANLFTIYLSRLTSRLSPHCF